MKLVFCEFPLMPSASHLQRMALLLLDKSSFLVIFGGLTPLSHNKETLLGATADKTLKNYHRLLGKYFKLNISATFHLSYTRIVEPCREPPKSMKA